MTDRRPENIARLARERWDVLVVGGGINGAGVARDLAMRAAELPGGLRVALGATTGTNGW